MKTRVSTRQTPTPNPSPQGGGERAPDVRDRIVAPADLPAALPASASRMHLRVAGLTKHFGVFTALDDVSLEVEKGKLVCFLGPSGCGKTTLLRVIAGLEVQDAGRIEIAGRDVTRLPPARRDFGIVFQSYALFPNLTVARNIAYGLETRKVDRARIASRVESTKPRDSEAVVTHH